MSKTSLTEGAHHVGLTVPNLAETTAFFVNTLGFDQVREFPDYPATFLTDGATMITLWQAVDPYSATPFDRKNVIGLHHLALKVESVNVLEELRQKLSAADGVDIEFTPEPLGESAVSHMMCAIPGGIRMEFIAPV